MPVTIDVTMLAAAMRLGDGATAPVPPLDGILARLLGVGSATAELLAPGAPEAIQNEAVVRFAGYLYDMPAAGRNTGYAAAWNNSGAAALCSPWIVRRAR